MTAPKEKKNSEETFFLSEHLCIDKKCHRNERINFESKNRIHKLFRVKDEGNKSYLFLCHVFG